MSSELHYLLFLTHHLLRQCMSGYSVETGHALSQQQHALSQQHAVTHKLPHEKNKFNTFIAAIFFFRIKRMPCKFQKNRYRNAISLC
jgi:hypothetical protein